MFFYRGVKAVASEDYSFAVNMYRVSASWAYKAAQYNLGVMYFRGDGVAVDKPLGMAWLALAAERGDREYVQAREAAYADMSAEEFAHANELWRELRKTYGDDSALKRARNRWQQVKTAATGSHLGEGTGPVLIGGRADLGRNTEVMGSASDNTRSGWGIVGVGAVDGSIAYRQMRESTNPYDVKFKQAPAGSVVVEDIIPSGETGPDARTRPTRFY